LSRVCLQKLLNLSSTRLVLPYLCQTAPFLEQLRTAPRRPKPGSPTACCCCGYLPAGLGCARLVMAAASVAWGASAPWAVAAAPTGCARQWLRRWHGGGSWATLSYESPWAHYFGGYQDRLLGGSLGLLGLCHTAPDDVRRKDYGGEVLG
jgi:hypothetical protein